MTVRAGGTFLCIGIITMVGCGAKADVSVGKSRPLKEFQAATGTWAGEDKGASVTLSLREGRFQAIFKGGDWRSVVKGTAKVENSMVVLNASEFNGRPAQKAGERMPAKFTHSPDWHTLTSEEGLSLRRKL